MNRSLPPQIAEIQNGAVVWAKLQAIDYSLLGYFLSCHLIVEHYLTELLKVLHPGLDWEGPRLTFSQKLALLSRLKMPDKYNSLAAIKHMNAVRNKIGHRVDFRLQPEDLLPFRRFLDKALVVKRKLPEEPHELLEFFTAMVCAFFGAFIGAQAAKQRRQ